MSFIGTLSCRDRPDFRHIVSCAEGEIDMASKKTSSTTGVVAPLEQRQRQYVREAEEIKYEGLLGTVERSADEDRPIGEGIATGGRSVELQGPRLTKRLSGLRRINFQDDNRGVESARDYRSRGRDGRDDSCGWLESFGVATCLDRRWNGKLP